MYEGYNISAEDIALLAAHGIRPIAGAHDNGLVHSHSGEGSDDPTYGPNNKNAGKPGYDINGRPLSDGGLPAGFVIGRNGELIPPGTGATAGPGVPAGTMFRLGDNVYWWNGKSITQASAADSKTYRGDYDLDPTSSTGYANNGTAGNTTGAVGSGSGTRLASDDPRYWQLEYDKLASDYMNMGLDAESARRQALGILIGQRNANAVELANQRQTFAKTAAEFAANPRDYAADMLYRQSAGVTDNPYGSVGTEGFGDYQDSLTARYDEMFGPNSPTAKGLAQAEQLYLTPPPAEFYDADTRAQLGLQPTAAQAASGAKLINYGFNTPGDAQSFAAQIKGATPEQLAALEALAKKMSGAPMSAAKGGQLDFGGLVKGRTQDGFSPASSEGGTNLNIHERAVVVGESGHVYATLGEKRPDGTMRAEQLMIKPLKSETDKDKKLAEAGKAQVESQKETLASFAGGGTVKAEDDFLGALSSHLQNISGPASFASGGGMRFSNIGGVGGNIMNYIKDSRRGTATAAQREQSHADRLRSQGWLAKFDSDGNFTIGEGGGAVKYSKGTTADMYERGARQLRANADPLQYSTGGAQQGFTGGSLMRPDERSAMQLRLSAGRPLIPEVAAPTNTRAASASSATGTAGRRHADDSAVGQMRALLSTYGVQTPGGQDLPDPRNLSADVIARAERDPVFKDLLAAAYSGVGIDPRGLFAQIERYRPTQAFNVPQVRWT